MSRKCAYYLRVSSDLQDYERQINDFNSTVKEFNLSFNKKNTYKDKLSGFLDEGKREGLSALMKEAVEQNIEVVLIWELSRLGRNQKDLHTYADFFQRNGINIYFYTQKFWLLDEHKNINPQASLSFAMLGWHAEYEARLTKERFHSAKVLNESLGKYNGGNITFGYSVDESNKYVINKKIIEGLEVSEYDIVKDVFDLYEEGLTCSKICRLCKSKGYPKKVSNSHTLARLLRDTSYIGYKKTKLGKRPLPPIIDPPQFNKVQELIDQNKTKADKGKKHVYLLRGVLKCSFCEEYYVGKQTDDGYICPKNSGSNKVNKNSSCEGGNISISNIDGVIWERCKAMLAYIKTDGFDNLMEGTSVAINDLQNQIVNYKNLISKLESSRKKTNIIFQNDGYTLKEYQKKIKSINNEKKDCEREITNIQSKIRYNENIRLETNKLSKRKENINLITDRNQIKTIIKGLIKSIKFFKCSTFKTVVFIKYNNGNNETLLYNSVSKKGNFYKLINSNYIRLDKENSQFFMLRNTQNIIFRARTEILKKNGIGKNLPKVVTLQEFGRLLRVHNMEDVLESDFLDPYPDKNNSDILDFDSLMKHEDIPSIIDTYPYNKMTYFKDINVKRFNRKKIIK